MVRWWVTTAPAAVTTDAATSAYRRRRAGVRAARLVSASTHRNSGIATPS